LGIVGQKLALVLKKFYETMCRRIFLLGRKNVLRDGEENAGVFPKDMNIKDLLGVAQSKVL